MSEVASLDAGARIVHASSHHDEYGTSNILDRSAEKPWVSNGIFPQVLVVSLPSLVDVQSVEIKAYNVKDVLLERSTESSPQNFEEICEKRLPRGSPQKETLSNKELTARFLKITLISGHDFFCAIYSLSVKGEESSGRLKSSASTFSQNNKASNSNGSGDGFDFQEADQQLQPFMFSFNSGKGGVDDDDDNNDDDGNDVSKPGPTNVFRLPSSKKVRLSGQTKTPVAAAPAHLDPDGHEEIPQEETNSWNPVVGEYEDKELPPTNGGQNNGVDFVISPGGGDDDDNDDDGNNEDGSWQDFGVRFGF